MKNFKIMSGFIALTVLSVSLWVSCDFDYGEIKNNSQSFSQNPVSANREPSVRWFDGKNFRNRQRRGTFLLNGDTCVCRLPRQKKKLPAY
jgi:hypothetical protein